MALLQPKVNYLTNKELLREIHRSKNTFSYYLDKAYEDYDAIVEDINDIDDTLIEATRALKAKRMIQAQKATLKEQGLKNHQIKVDDIDPSSIPVSSLVFRVMTFEHIPEAEGKTKVAKKVSDNHVRLNFPPYKHYIIEDGERREVGRSHWKDALENGQFCQDHGKITNRLALMFMKLVERYSQRGNWRGYSYIDEMRSQALLQLSVMGLKFNEARSDNPFAYYSVMVGNAFTHVLNLEKRSQSIRDDMLVMAGVTPSMTRQIENSIAQKAAANGELPEQNKAKRGAPKKTVYTQDTSWNASNTTFPRPGSKD